MKSNETRMHSSRMCTSHCSGHHSCHAWPLPHMSPATHAPPTMHAPCHTCSLPCRSPCHTCPPHHVCHPLPHMHAPCHACAPAMHAPLPYMPPAAHNSPVDRQTPLKTLPSQTSFTGGKYVKLPKALCPFVGECCRRAEEIFE